MPATVWRTYVGNAVIDVGRWIRGRSLRPDADAPFNDAIGDAEKDVGEQHDLVRQLIKQALEKPTAEQFVDFFAFASRFRRLAVWNVYMVRIQRPGARIVATEHEWRREGRYVLPDAVPVIILWPFSPIRFVYELGDTGPEIDRESINDPFAVTGRFDDQILPKIRSSLAKQRRFKIKVEYRPRGSNLAGTASSHPQRHSILPSVPSESVSDGNNTLIPHFRVILNDRLGPMETFVTLAHELAHIFCGHLGECVSSTREGDESGWPDRRRVNPATKEIEAEAVAYLVASRAGLTTRSADYLRDYTSQESLTGIDLEMIIRAAARIERLAGLQCGTLAFK